jgi:protein-S-isoprenylcysteine O-methyltransferase Ste14
MTTCARRRGLIITMLNTLELRVPPPLLTAVAALMMWAGARNALPWYRPAWVRPASIGAALIGIGLILLAIRTLQRARTTISPTRPDRTKDLVTTGVFALSRNPIYLGGLFVLLGFGLHLWQPQALVAVPLWAAWIHRFQILPEERVLRPMFGDAFAAYTARTRRWI